MFKILRKNVRVFLHSVSELMQPSTGLGISQVMWLQVELALMWCVLGST